MIAEAAQAVQQMPPAVSQVNPGLYIAFGALLGALIGSGATIYWQWILRKEKYNEIIFKEKVEAYKCLNESLAELQHQVIIEKGVKNKELIDSFFHFIKCLVESAYMVSGGVMSAADEIATVADRRSY